MALHPPIFPIDGPVMPEQRQIGRGASIDLLRDRLDDATHQWLIGPRRTGKTSVAKAVLARLRADGGVALDIDMSKLSITTELDLAGEIARQAQAAHAGLPRVARRLTGLVRRRAGDAKRLGKTLEELGFGDDGEALAAVAPC